jgi:RNA polymerase sigma-70 factor (ECF subfamily)
MFIFLFTAVRVHVPQAHDIREDRWQTRHSSLRNRADMSNSPSGTLPIRVFSSFTVVPPHRDVRAALAALSEEDLLRLRAIAQLRACSLPGGISWSDLLHEAVLRALTGARPWPPGVPLPAFLAGVMRSLCDEQWRRHRRQDHLPTLHDGGGADDPERACAAAEALAAIQRLFASDKAALKVITGLISGMAADDIRRHYGLSSVEYDTTRRRIRRTLLRHGLAWSWP